MQKLFLRILFAIFLALFLVFAFSAYQYYKALRSDDPIVPYLFVELGGATIVRGAIAIDMIQGDRYDLREKDTIITAKNSLAIVTWPDRSETRLGSETRMQIDRMQVARDYTSIEIEFALAEGQVWSTVVRTIYPGSYFRTKIPGQGVVAGVRGTVYDIDLRQGYIRSLDHSISLTDRKGNLVSLLPGEIVSVKDILRKLSQDVVDNTWTLVNQARDIVFLERHREQIQATIDKLSGKDSSWWDTFVRWVLGFFPSYDSLEAFRMILGGGDILTNASISRQQVLSIYQKVQDTNFVQEREKIRTYITTRSDVLGGDVEYMDVFARGAIWDALSMSGGTIDSASVFVRDYIGDLDANIRSVLQIVPLGELDTKARETLRQLVK